MNDQNQSQYESQMSNEQPRRGINRIEGFVSGVLFVLACRISMDFYEWWEHAPWVTATNETALMLSAPLTCLVFLVVIWISQQISRYYYAYHGFAFPERRKPIKASGFLAFMLGVFMTHIFLSVLVVFW